MENWAVMLVSGVILMNSLALWFITRAMKSIISSVEDMMEVSGYDENAESIVVSEHIAERERAWEERVARLKEEMAEGLDVAKHTSRPAEILAEGVVNIPHDQINLTQHRPVEEVAE